MAKKSTSPDKLDVILNAAQQRFGMFGLSKTTMHEIAADVGMSKAALYYYFPDKEALFRAVIQKEQDDFMKHMEKVVQCGKKADVVLLRYVELRHKYFRNLINLSKLRNFTPANLKPLFGDLFEKFKEKEVELLVDIHRMGIKEGEFKIKNPRKYAELFLSILHGLRLTIVTKKDTSSFEKADYDKLERKLKLATTIYIKGIMNDE